MLLLLLFKMSELLPLSRFLAGGLPLARVLLLAFTFGSLLPPRGALWFAVVTWQQDNAPAVWQHSFTCDGLGLTCVLVSTNPMTTFWNTSHVLIQLMGHKSQVELDCHLFSQTQRKRHDDLQNQVEHPYKTHLKKFLSVIAVWGLAECLVDR